MKLIELHILQSFPVSCLNRDDVGAPKTAVFGGANRARISSQCLKRAIREQAQEVESPRLFAGQRSRLIIEPLAERLLTHGVPEDKATEVAKQVGQLPGQDRRGRGEERAAQGQDTDVPFPAGDRCHRQSFGGNRGEGPEGQGL